MMNRLTANSIRARALRMCLGFVLGFTFSYAAEGSPALRYVSELLEPAATLDLLPRASRRPSIDEITL